MARKNRSLEENERREKIRKTAICTNDEHL